MQSVQMVDIYKTYLTHIPVIYAKPVYPNRVSPTVFLYHGWSSNKENYIFMAKVIAAHGFHVIVPDAIHHGERGEIDYNDQYIMETYFWEVVFSTVEEFRDLLLKARKSFNINMDRISVMGSSMGGMIASGIFPLDKQLKALVVMNGACAWLDAEKKVKEARCLDRTSSGKIEKIKKYDPINHKESLVPRPILIQHGEQDASIPVETQTYFYEKLLPHYNEHPSNIRLTVIPNLNHHKTIAMLEEGIDWLLCHNTIDGIIT